MKSPKPDPNKEAARIVKSTAGRPEQSPKGLEAAWRDWERRIQSVDARTRTLLRAAFEAGYEAGEMKRSEG